MLVLLWLKRYSKDLFFKLNYVEMSSTCVNVSLYRRLALRLLIYGGITLKIKAFFYPEMFF